MNGRDNPARRPPVLPPQTGDTDPETPSTHASDGDGDAFSGVGDLRPRLGVGLAGTPADLVGVDLDGIRLTAFLASGGMGLVYEGWQDPPGRAVAVKLVRPELVSPAHRRRFEHEAAVLARLRHPGIAQIHLVGTCRLDGHDIPYFVMELIPGARTITRYAREARIAFRERVACFAEACEAVAHGHRKGVIHRDLKPGNILVDAGGLPKVIDFGVARSTDADIALTTLHTGVGQLIGTMQYMSPEQCGGDAADLDTRSDVYSLGIVLHELACGEPPYDLSGTTLPEAIRLVREAEPFSGGSGGRSLPRDIRLIIRKCLEKDRRLRYDTAGELAADLRRHLAGDTIIARPATALESLVRFVRRHRATAVATALVACTLVAALVGISFFAVRAERSRQRAEAATAVARAEFAKAQRELYAANCFRIEGLGRAGILDPARRLLAETTALMPGDGQPIELRILAAGLDRSDEVVDAGSPIRCLAFLAETDTLVTGSDDGLIRVWSGRPRRAVATLPGEIGPLTGLMTSPDGEVLLAAGRSGTARLWRTADWQPVATLAGHAKSLDAAIFDPSGRYVATASWDGTARLWDARSGTLLHRFGGEPEAAGKRMPAVCFDHAGGRLLTGRGDGMITVWEVPGGRRLAETLPTGSNLYGLAVAPDDGRFATASLDGVVRVFDLDTAAERLTLEGHTGSVRSLAFSPDGRRIATASEDRTIRLWRCVDGSEEMVLEHAAPVYGIRFDRAGRWLAAASSDCTAAVWRLEATPRRHVLRGHADSLSRVAVRNDGAILATASSDGTARLWSLTDPGEPPALVGHEGPIRAVAADPRAGLLATGGEDRSVRLWDWRTGRELFRFEDHVGGIGSVGFSRDGGRLFADALHRGGAIRVWDVAGRRLLLDLRGSTCLGSDSTLSPDGRLLVVRSEDLATACLVPIDEPDRVRKLTGHADYVSSAAWSPDGSLVLTGSYDATALLWESATGRVTHRLTGHYDRVLRVAFSPDGRLAATGSADGTVRLWDAASGAGLGTLGGHAGAVRHLVFQPGGRLLATGCDDVSVMLWDTGSGRRHAELRGHAHQIRVVAFTPDGQRLVTGGSDGLLRVWRVLDGTELVSLSAGGGPIAAVAFPPTGECLAAVARGSSRALLAGWSTRQREAAREP
jgi:WD40 repeat protein